jgi:hypothetical protein
MRAGQARGGLRSVRCAGLAGSLRPEPVGQQRRVVPRTGTDLQDPMPRVGTQRGQHHRDDVRHGPRRDRRPSGDHPRSRRDLGPAAPPRRTCGETGAGQPGSVVAGWWRGGQPLLVGQQAQQQHLIKLVQAQGRFAVHLAGVPPCPEHRTRPAAGLTATPLINRMIQEQGVQGDHCPTLNRPDPTRGTPPSPFPVRHDLAQHLAQWVVAGLGSRGTTADHRPHPATVCDTAGGIGCSRGSCSEPLATFMLGTDTPTGTVTPFLVVVVTG